jgi:hypothetical protein
MVSPDTGRDHGRTIDKYGIIDKNGREILGPTFDSISTDLFEGLAPFRIGDKWGTMTQIGKLVSVRDLPPLIVFSGD